MNGLFLLDPVVPGSMVAKQPQGGLCQQARPSNIPFEDTYAAILHHTVGILAEALNYVGAAVVATMLAPGVRRRGEVRRRADLMAAARNAGCEVVEQG
jgi:hypothetical protein